MKNRDKKMKGLSDYMVNMLRLTFNASFQLTLCTANCILSYHV